MKKVSGRIVLCIVVQLLAPLVIANTEAQEGPIEVKPKDVTVLWGVETLFTDSRVAEMHGGFIGGWTSLDDYFTWNVEVLETDDFEVEITYCSIGPGGSEY